MDNIRSILGRLIAVKISGQIKTVKRRGKTMNLAQIIKYEGDNQTFVWKHPCEDFNSLTQLIVHESQEALFFMNGQGGTVTVA